MTREIAGLSIVITGASSGIGRAAALAFARRGARVALAARRTELIEEVARECRNLGTQAIAVPTDVTDAGAVEHLAQAARRTFGAIDVWINNAGTGVFGPYPDADIALHRRFLQRTRRADELLPCLDSGLRRPLDFAKRLLEGDLAGWGALLGDQWFLHEIEFLPFAER